MDEEAKAVQEGAKAIQETAKVAKKGLEIVEKAGPFLDRVFGSAVVDAVGIVGDRLRYYRLVQLFRLRDKTESLLAERGVSETRSVPPKLALPLLEAATIEDNEELHDLWARLLANAMDAGAKPVTRSFIGILEQFEPGDARLLEFVYRSTHEERSTISPHRLGAGSLTYELGELADAMGMPKEDCELSLFNLDRLGCLSVNVTHVEDKPDDTYRPIHRFFVSLTALGKATVEACMR